MNGDNRRVLHLWSVGPDVEMLQRILFSIGYNVGPIDGIFGPMTMQAVIDFQIDNNLVADGIVGPQTWAAIDLVYP